MNSSLIEKAVSFAKAAHDSIGHKRKYTDEPYWVHPERVAGIVAAVSNDENVIAAAWLHDVLEDVAPINHDFNDIAIKCELGERVLRLFLEVTDISKPEFGNRATRKLLDRQHLAKASLEGKLIKLADLIDNIIDITKYDPNFAKVFKNEAKLSMPYLSSGNQQLYQRLNLLLS